MRGDTETYRQVRQWQREVEGTDGVFGVARAKRETVEHRRERAKTDKVELIIRTEGVTIHERSSYGHDPRNIPG